MHGKKGITPPPGTTLPDLPIRQALGAVSVFMAIAGGNWEDAGKQYAELVNANSGASVGCFGRK
jgi:hypothetical protein